MAVERITVSLDAELAAALRDAADEDGINVSAWVAGALERRLGTRGLHTVIRDYEAEFGAFTDEELAAARKRIRG